MSFRSLRAVAASFILSLLIGNPLASADVKRPLVIYPLGDSITRGIDDIGYRQFLFDGLKSEGIDVEFVGSLSHGPVGFSQSRHDGHNGWTIGKLDHRVGEWLSEFEPDVILLMAGANDIQRKFWDWKGMPSRMSRLIDTITTARPNAVLLISELTVLPLDIIDRQAVVFNAQLRALVAEKASAGKRVHFVPMYDTVSKDELIKFDHPNSEGNRKIAARWIEAIRGLGLLGRP